MSSAQKETIFVDQDDDITAIIDKVITSKYKIVALVLPKRATVLQSVVNMKLLKKSATDVGKSFVLITSEAALTPIAAATGIYMAKTLQSKPAVPKAAKTETEEQVDVPAEDAGEAPIDPTKTIGVLALGRENEEDDIEVGAEEDDSTGGKKAKSAKAKRIHIPNFERFRLWFILLIVFIIFLITGGVYAQAALPKANFTVTTENTEIPVNHNITANTATKTTDVAASKVPLSNKEITKTDSEKTATTGEKDVGTKAKGTAEFYNCSKSDKLSDTNINLPIGTKLVYSSFTFITEEAVVVQPSSYVGDTCQKNKVTATIDVDAQGAGDKYNLGARNYTVAGYSSITAVGSEMTGGTSQIVKIVTQADVDKARQTVLDRSNTAGADQLKSQLETTGYAAIPDTLVVGTPKITSKPAVGEEGSEVTVSVTTIYNMSGVKQDDIKPIIEDIVNGKINKEQQVIVDNGISKATYKLVEKKPGGDIIFTIDLTAVAGPQLDANTVSEMVKGKKKGEAIDLIKERPGVKDVTADYSPFWVVKAPKAQKRITVVFVKSTDAE